MAWNDSPPKKEELQAFSSPIEKEVNSDTPDALSSLGRGLGQGLTFGLQDEAAGALDSLGQLGDWEKMKQAYLASRDDSRAKNEAAEKAHEYIYGAGNIAGAVGGALAGGALGLGVKAGGALLPAGVGTIGELAANAGLQGAAQGYGSSNADSVTEDLSNAAKGGLAGAAIGGLLGGAGKAITSPELKKGVGKLLGKASGVSDDALEGLYNNPDMLKNSKTLDELVAEYKKLGLGLNQERTAASKNALSKLTDEGLHAVDEITPKLNETIKTVDGSPIGVKEIAKTGQGSGVNKEVDDIIRQLEEGYGKKGILTDAQMGEEVRSLQNQGWDAGRAQETNKALASQRTSGVLNEILKKQNPAYGQAMEPVSELSQILSKLENTIGDYSSEESNKIISALKRAMNKTDVTPDELKALQALDSKVGSNLAEGVKETRLANEFDPKFHLGEGSSLKHGLLQAGLRKAGRFGAEKLITSAKESATNPGVLSKALRSDSLYQGLGRASSSDIVDDQAKSPKEVINNIEKNNEPATLSRNLSDYSDDELTQVANNVLASDPTNAAAKQLVTSLQNQDRSKKNAALFSMMQNPKTRELLKLNK